MPSFVRPPIVAQYFVILVDLSGDDQYESFNLATLPSGQQLLLKNVNYDSNHNFYRLELTGCREYSVEFMVKLNETFGHPKEARLYHAELTESFRSLPVGKDLALIGIPRVVDMDDSRGPKMSRICTKVRLDLTIRQFLSDRMVNPLKDQVAQVNHLKLLGSLQTSGGLSDCKIITKDGDYIESHKFLLSLKSEVIRTAFGAEGMEEANKNLFTMEFSTQVVRLILPHFYTGELPQIDSETVIDAYKLAHLYQIEELKIHVVKEILRRAKELIEVGNILEFLVFADTYELADVFKICGEFLRANGAEVVKLPWWEDFCSERGKILGKLAVMQNK